MEHVFEHLFGPARAGRQQHCSSNLWDCQESMECVVWLSHLVSYNLTRMMINSKRGKTNNTCPAAPPRKCSRRGRRRRRRGGRRRCRRSRGSRAPRATRRPRPSDSQGGTRGLQCDYSEFGEEASSSHLKQMPVGTDGLSQLMLESE